MSDLIKLEEIKVSFSGTPVLTGVSTKIKSGEIVGIIGPNGSGKTTLFNIISGFITPDSGHIYFEDKLIDNLSPHLRAKLGIGRVFQNFGIFKEMTLMENMLTAIESKQSLFETLLPWTKKSKENVELAISYLKKVKLDSKAYNLSSSLSGGQLRLLEIMRLIAFGAKLLLLDEPTAGVSPKMKGEIAELISSLKDSNHTVLIIEHDLSFIESISERIIVMNEGICALEGKPSDIRNNSQVQEIYFGKGI
jgi:ABC-type branched-subunit amino acid transport system ATPase component